MANFSLLNPTVFVHDKDFTSFLNKATFKTMATELDNTTFGAVGGYRSRIGGLLDVSLAASGFLDFAASGMDANAFAGLGVQEQVVTVTPQNLEQAVAYLWLAERIDYMFFGKVGDLAPFAMTGRSSDSQGVIRGQLASQSRSISATGVIGSVLTLAGPVAATNFMYCSFHIFTAATTITVQVQSAPTSGFAAPTTRATIGPLTVAGGTWVARVPGPITDGFWRLNCSAITGTFQVAGAIGVR